MGNKAGDFVWYELLTSDPDKAAAFYKKVVGLDAKDSGMDGYWLFEAPGGGQVGGMMKIDDDMAANGARPAWFGYVHVDDVDAAAQTIKDKSGAIHIEPRDIPDVGRFAMGADPAGAPFYVMKTKDDDTSQSFSASHAKGHVGWNELGTPDIDKALSFYGAVCGWSAGERMEMDQGPYQMIQHGDGAIGGMMDPGDAMPPFWNYYFWSDGVEAAIGRTKDAGGQLMFGPHEIPGGDVIMFGVDPLGAPFCLVGPR